MASELKRLMLSGVLAVALAGPSVALTVPRPDRADPRIREADYDPLQVYQLTGTFRSALQVVFGGTETIQHVALGDTVAWEVAADHNILFLKPREKHPPTNLIVTTTRESPQGAETRNYAFELEIRSGRISAATPMTFFQVRFRYPQDEALAVRAAQISAVSAQAAAASKSVIDLKLEHAVLEGKRNFAYRVQGSSALQPSEVSDNGLFTVMRFPGAEAIPAIFAVGVSGEESLTPFDVRGQFVVIHGIAKGYRLRRGSEVLCVYNEALDPYGVDPGTGTASHEVVRTIDASSGGERRP
jgi:type IV secretion system protein VirB9